MIRINDDYYITVDSYNYTACRDKHKTDKHGKNTYSVIGHYPSIEGALRGIINDMNKRAFTEATYSLKEALEVIQQSNKEFTDLLREVCNDGKRKTD